MQTRAALYAPASIYPTCGLIGAGTLGDLQTSQTVYKWSSTGVSIAGAAVSGFAAAGIIGSTAWIPFIGPAVAAVTLGLNLIFNRASQTQKVVSTQIADDVEKQLKANVAAYLSGPRTEASQVYALANFDRGWAFIQSPQGCGAPELADAGRRCIAERQEGARPQWDVCAPNCPNWFELYRYPIANDTQVNTNPIVNALAPGASKEELAQLTWLVPVVLMVIGVALL